MSEAFEAPRIRIGRNDLHIEFESLFGPGGEAQARRFVRRVFAFPQVGSLRLEPGAGKATVHFQIPQAERKSFLGSLASAIGSPEEGLDDAGLPHWSSSESTGLHRFGQIVSTFEIAQTGSGRLELRHDALAKDPALGRRIEDAARTVPGVGQVSVGSKGKLRVTYHPDSTDLLRLIRLAEAQLSQPGSSLATLTPDPAKMGFANATLGLAAVGEFAVPGVLPVCIGMLVVSNLGTIRDAGKQLSRGKLGLPVLYTALLGCSITTGQIVAHALMEWSFRFWERRSNLALAEECRTLLEENLPIPAEARLVRSDKVDAQVPSDLLRAGHRIRIEAPAAIPVDGRIVGGGALIEETSVRGSTTPVRKAFGDEVFAGGRLLAGNIEVEVLRTGTQTQAAQIARSVIEGARGLGRDPVLRRKTEGMADRPVPATLAIAGVGWTVGGLFTVGAVLHQDHASGPNMAVPMETLRGMNLALRKGAVVRQGSALPRLADSRFVVLDDHPAWTVPKIEVESLQSRLAESEKNNLLRYVAGAALYLGDQRSEALADACLGLGLVVRQPPLVSLDAERIVVHQGEHTVVLRNGAGPGKKEAIPPLKVEIDGEDVATLKFRPGNLPRATKAVLELRRRGAEVFLLSSRPEPETERLARQLGVELFSGDFSEEEKIRFLQGLKRRGVLATHIANGEIRPELAREAHVSVSMGGTNGLSSETTDIVVLGDSLDAFVETFALAQGYHERVRAACRRALLPNLLCIAGGYAGVLNGITSGLIANVGVYKVYQQAAQSLRASVRPDGIVRIGP